ncbi:MAG: hypothetical protein PVF17_00805 [Ignavibacteria bacterium]|jgi:hypothetical protein
MITDNYPAPITCCCSLAGTPACMACLQNQYAYKYEIVYKDGIRTEKIKIQKNEVA